VVDKVVQYKSSIFKFLTQNSTWFGRINCNMLEVSNWVYIWTC
jgi:hypothetical protein